MRLRGRLIIFLGCMWLLFMAFIYMGTQYYLLKNIKNVESSEFKKDIDRVQKAMDQSFQSLSIFTSDWSYWNDAYEYVINNYPKFAVDNVDLLTFAFARINLLIYLDINNKIVLGVSVDKNFKNFIPFPRGLEKYIYPGSILLKHKEAIKNTYGLAYVNDCIMLISSAAVSNTDFTKPLVGTLVTGRYFTQSVLDAMSKDVSLPLKLYIINHIKHDELLQNLARKAKENQQFESYINYKAENLAVGYIILRDINQNPIAIIEIDLPRSSYLSGIKAIRYYLMTLVLSGILLGILIWYLLRIFVLARLEKLTHKIQEINIKHDYAARLKVDAHDEISDLSSEFNSMMKTIEYSDQHIHQQVDELEKSKDRLEEMNKKLVNEVNERKQAEIKASQLSDRLILASRKAGMADIASSVLYSLGNILNNVVTNIVIIKQGLKNYQSKLVDEFVSEKPNDTLKASADVSNVPKEMKKHTDYIISEIVNLEKNISRMKNVLSMQETLSNTTEIIEEVKITKIIDDALLINKAIYKKSKIQIEKNYSFNGKVTIDSVKLLHVLVNVTKCAIESLVSSKIDERKLLVTTESTDVDVVKITLSENGGGLSVEDINKMIKFGEISDYTKLGFALQTGAIFCKEMGGDLVLESKGDELGIIFIILLPIYPPENK